MKNPGLVALAQECGITYAEALLVFGIRPAPSSPEPGKEGGA